MSKYPEVYRIVAEAIEDGNFSTKVDISDFHISISMMIPKRSENPLVIRQVFFFSDTTVFDGSLEESYVFYDRGWFRGTVSFPFDDLFFETSDAPVRSRIRDIFRKLYNMEKQNRVLRQRQRLLDLDSSVAAQLQKENPSLVKHD